MYDRFVSADLIAALQDTPVILLNGARQTGKSTLIEQLQDKGIFKGRLVTMDDAATLAAAKNDPEGFLAGLGNTVAIDEIQRAPELFLSIKKQVDKNRKTTRIILSGSADVMTLPAVADSLAGRIEVHTLWPLSQDEIAGKQSAFLKTLTSSDKVFKNIMTNQEDIIHAMVKGGYPEALERADISRRSKWMDSYIQSVIQKDIRELSNIEGLIQIPNVLQLITTRVGSTINWSDISRLSGIKNTTLQRYIALLEKVFLILKIPAWTPNAEGEFVKSPKVFLGDCGLLSHLRGESAESLLLNRSNLGPILENFIIMEIIKQLSWSELYMKPYHFSIHRGEEIDLVLEDRKKQLYGIEIKSSVSLQAKDFNGLKRLQQIAGKKFKKGIVLYTGNEVLSGFGDDLYAVPVGCVFGQIQ